MSALLANLLGGTSLGKASMSKRYTSNTPSEPKTIQEAYQLTSNDLKRNRIRKRKPANWSDKTWEAYQSIMLDHVRRLGDQDGYNGGSRIVSNFEKPSSWTNEMWDAYRASYDDGEERYENE